MKNYLNFESDIKNLESELEKLKDPYNQGGLQKLTQIRFQKLKMS
jgi:acetyl-CoA carboxylase carboxyl transferase subunit alpha